MKLQTCPNDWSCVATAFAMVIHVPVRMIFDFLGHDGGKVVFENGDRAGFHPSECIAFLQLLDSSYTCTTIEVTPKHTNGKEVIDVTYGVSIAVRRARVLAFMQGRIGVVSGTNPNGRGHAMAWDGQNFYDPAGIGIVFSATELEQTGFQLDFFWWIKSVT